MEKFIKSPQRPLRLIEREPSGVRCASARENSSISFLQSEMWGEFKSRFGWKAQYFCLEKEEQGSAAFSQSPLLVLNRKLAPGFSFAYVPWGPETECSAEELCGLSKELKPFLPRNTIFIRYDIPWQNNRSLLTAHRTEGTRSLLKKAAVDVQAPDTVIIDLTQSCEEILANMKSKWRYNISLAEKKGVEVKSYSRETLSLVSEPLVRSPLSLFYTLLKETAKRDRIFIHSFDYYKTLFELCEKDSECELRLYTAIHEQDTLASIAVLFRGEWATYLYGASSNIKRNLMAPYALQWQAMQDAKKKGCRHYDLFGIPPDEDPNHPMAGLYRFKTGFGGRIIHRPGCWDYPYKPAVYSLFSFAEKFRKKFILHRGAKIKRTQR